MKSLDIRDAERGNYKLCLFCYRRYSKEKREWKREIEGLTKQRGVSHTILVPFVELFC